MKGMERMPYRYRQQPLPNIWGTSGTKAYMNGLMVRKCEKTKRDTNILEDEFQHFLLYFWSLVKNHGMLTVLLELVDAETTI